jgi:hypothetical protein
MYKSFADQPPRTRRGGITNHPSGLSKAPTRPAPMFSLGEDGCRAGGMARAVPAANILNP